MFILTARLRRGRVLFGVAALVLACGLFTAAAGFHSVWGAQTVSAPLAPTHIKTNDDRVAYLESYGWTVNPKALAIEELRVPDVFDESYASYLSLQNEQGFDLEQYTGKKVKRYTYEITNYPTGESGVQVSLLLYKNKVIGGEVLLGNGQLQSLSQASAK